MIFPEFQTQEELLPSLRKLEAHPDSVILIAIEQPEVCNFYRVTWVWLSKAERSTLKTPHERARKKRALLFNAKHDPHLAPRFTVLPWGRM